MRIALLLARLHGCPDLEVLSGPSVSYREQVVEFKRLSTNVGSATVYAEVQLWESDGGLTRRKKFPAPIPQPLVIIVPPSGVVPPGGMEPTSLDELRALTPEIDGIGAAFGFAAPNDPGLFPKLPEVPATP